MVRLAYNHQQGQQAALSTGMSKSWVFARIAVVVFASDVRLANTEITMW
jgi:hypothetical protein